MGGPSGSYPGGGYGGAGMQGGAMAGMQPGTEYWFEICSNFSDILLDKIDSQFCDPRTSQAYTLSVAFETTQEFQMQMFKTRMISVL